MCFIDTISNTCEVVKGSEQIVKQSFALSVHGLVFVLKKSDVQTLSCVHEVECI